MARWGKTLYKGGAQRPPRPGSSDNASTSWYAYPTLYDTPETSLGGGAGLRYQLNDEGTHLRLDYALGKEGGGLYITALTPF